MIDSPGSRMIAMARLPRLIRDAVRDFKRQTGLTVVTTLGTITPDKRTHRLPLPRVHLSFPQITSDLRSCTLFWPSPCFETASMIAERAIPMKGAVVLTWRPRPRRKTHSQPSRSNF
jgi:hypothetical protein